MCVSEREKRANVTWLADCKHIYIFKLFPGRRTDFWNINILSSDIVPISSGMTTPSKKHFEDSLKEYF